MSDVERGPAGGHHAHMPSDVTSRPSFFDHFAEKASAFFSRPTFFAFCVLLVLVWAPSYFVFGSIDTWQPVINTCTTIITFLMVALLQNSQSRANKAVQDKLNAQAAALAVLMEAVAEDRPRLRDAVTELRDAVGLEERESS